VGCGDETCPPADGGGDGNEGWHEGVGDDKAWDFSRPRLTMRSHLRFTLYASIKTRIVHGRERVVHCKSSAS